MSFMNKSFPKPHPLLGSVSKVPPFQLPPLNPPQLILLLETIGVNFLFISFLKITYAFPRLKEENCITQVSIISSYFI